MPSIAAMEKEIADWNVVKRVCLRQLLDGKGSGRSANMAHKNACDRITELTLKLKRAKGRRK